MIAPTGLKTRVRVSYPYHDMFTYSFGDGDQTIAMKLFGKTFANTIHSLVRTGNNDKIILLTQILLFSYTIPVQLGAPIYYRGMYLFTVFSSSLLLLAPILLFNTEVVKRLLTRFEAQFALLNAFLLGISMIFSFENTEIALAHSMLCVNASTMVAGLDAAVKRGKVLLMNAWTIVVAMLMVRIVNLKHPEHDAFKMQMSPVVENFTSRCILNLIWLCVARFILQWRYPSAYVSLKGPMVAASVDKAVHDRLMNVPVFSDIVFSPDDNSPKVKIVMNVLKPFDHDPRDTIGRHVFGEYFCNKYLYRTLQRIHTITFISMSFPCLIYIQAITVEEPRLITSRDICIVLFLICHSLLSFLFANTKIMKLGLQSMELIIFSVSIFAISFSSVYIGYGSHRILFPISFLFFGVIIVVSDAHRHRRGFSLCYCFGCLYLVVALHICIDLNLYDFNGFSIEIPGFNSWALRKLVLGWTENIILILLRNLYFLLRFPKHYLFLKSSMSATTVSLQTAEAFKSQTRGTSKNINII